MGPATSVLSDNAASFHSKIWKNMLQALGISCTNSTPYLSRSNGKSEANVRIVLDIIRKVAVKFPNKIRQLYPYIMHSVNSAPRKSLNGNSSFNILYGIPASTPFDTPLKSLQDPELQILDENKNFWAYREYVREQVSEFLTKYKDKYETLANTKIKHHVFKEGDTVYRKVIQFDLKTESRKLSYLFQGPYILARLLSRSTALLKDPATGKIHPAVVALHHLKPFENRPPDWQVPEVTPELLKPTSTKIKPKTVQEDHTKLQDYLDTQPTEEQLSDASSEENSDNETPKSGMKLRSGKII
jgi:hypothetical protein